MVCPECRTEVGSNMNACPSCGFNIREYALAYQRIYVWKLQSIRHNKGLIPDSLETLPVNVSFCPCCDSTDFASVDSNSELFGKYDYHCNNCRINW